MALIVTACLFRDAHTFPWDFIGMERPLIGTVHSYICEAIAPYTDPYWRPFLKGRPTLSELRSRQEHCEMLKPLVNYVDQVGNHGSVGKKVVEYLWRLDELKADISKIADRKFREGLITVPEEFLTLEGMSWLRK